MIDRLASALAGRYTIERELGAGGMATVYLAQDEKHKRRVALKVLRPELAAVIGADRFLKEIETTANLQHPHILPLHDSGVVDGTAFYVMPFVDGESLRDRLNRERQLPIDDALRIAREVASALDYAHRKGVIHRDIKPENILLHEGQALVADFGIALAAATTGGARMTETGMSLGTPHYMSPEQAMGERALDARADVYALGCVLYEMLVGEPPFTGPTAQAIVARVLTSAAEAPSARRSTVPANVSAAVLTALQKLPADRFATAALFAAALQDRAFASPGSDAASPANAHAIRHWKRIAIAMTVIALVGGIAAARTMTSAAHGGVSTPGLRAEVVLPDNLTLKSADAGRILLSPDGSHIVFVGQVSGSKPGGDAQSMLWLRTRDQLQATRIVGTEGARVPFFSLDGRRIGFAAGAALKVVDLDGGSVSVVTDTGIARSASAAAFAPDGSVYIAGVRGLMKLSTNGARTLASTRDVAAGEDVHSWPEMLPNGRGVIFTVEHAPNSNVNHYDVAVLDVATGKHRILAHGVMALFRRGYLLIVRADGALVAVPFDENSLAITGPEVLIANDVRVGPFGAVDITVANDGTLMYLAGGGAAGPAEFIWVTREGSITPVDSTWHADFDGVSLSPDGTRLAVSVEEATSLDVWVKQLDAGPKSKVTFGGRNHRPSWFPDGSRLAYIADEKAPFTLRAKRVDGNGDPEMLAVDSRNLSTGFVSHDGKWIVYRTTSTAAGNGDILAKRIGESASIPLVATEANERHPALSPDGRWLAYRSDETGKTEVYVRPFPNAGDGKWAISASGGTDPVWSHSGRELFYINGANEMVAASLSFQANPTVGAQRVLFKLPEGTRPNAASQRYDVSPDDRRFIMIRDLPAATSPASRERVVLVTNVFDDVRTKLTGKP